MNFSRAFVVQFQTSRYIICLNRTSVWNVTTIKISREHLWFNFKLLYIMRLNRISVWKVMPIGISWELPIFNFERLDILCTKIGLPCDKLWPFEYLESFRCSISSVSIYYAPESNFRVTRYDHLNFTIAFVVLFRASGYNIRLNRSSVLKVMTIWISRELPLFTFKCLDILCAWIGLQCDKLWPFEFLESFHCSISSV